MSFLKNQKLLAKKWIQKSQQFKTSLIREREKKLSKIAKNEDDKALLVKLLDQSFRSKSNKRAFEKIKHLLQKSKNQQLFPKKSFFFCFFLKFLGL